jgi:hypothetical protein
MPIAPDLTATKAYLGTDTSWSDAEITAALASETAAQVRAVRLPADPLDGNGNPVPQAYPADLAEALFRRVAHNLAVRALPLGVQAVIADGAVATNNVGGLDAEVRRLERPFRRVSVR